MIELSRIKKDKRVFGVMGDNRRNNSRPERLIVNSLGEGGIWVCNSNGNIENGDYITPSDYLGYGEKQDDDLLDRQTTSFIESQYRQEFCFVEMALHAMLDTRTLRSRFYQVLLGSSIYLSLLHHTPISDLPGCLYRIACAPAVLTRFPSLRSPYFLRSIHRYQTY